MRLATSRRSRLRPANTHSCWDGGSRDLQQAGAGPAAGQQSGGRARGGGAHARELYPLQGQLRGAATQARLHARGW